LSLIENPHSVGHQTGVKRGILMTTRDWKWTLTAGGLLVISPAYLDASEPRPAAAQGPAAGQNPPPATPLPPPNPAGPPRFKPMQPPVPAAQASAAPTAGSAAVSCPAGRPASFFQRCKLRLQDCFLGYPEFFEAPPLGHSIAMHYQTHVANGDAARMVLNQY